MGRFSGKVALVSGSSRGIGLACALAFAEGGADVVVNYLSHAEEAAEVAAEAERFGARTLVHRADVSDRTQVDAMFGAALERFGRIDAVVANAYQSIRQPFLDVTVDGLERTVAVTLFGAFHIAQAGARAMVERKIAGTITVIGSIHGESGFSNSTSYNICKFGLTGMVLTAANELARYGIRVNLVNPGWIDTPGERRYASEDELREAARALPFGRLAQPSEIGRVVAFLASDDASFVSGAVLRADGAQIAALGG